MAVEPNSLSVGPVPPVASSRLDLSTLTVGRIVEGRVMALTAEGALMATRQGALTVDLGARGAAIGEVLRFEVHAVGEGEGGARLGLTLLDRPAATATGSETASLDGSVQRALGQAVARAASGQSGLAPLFASLAGLVASSDASIPDPVRRLAAQLMGGRLGDGGAPTGEAVARAFRNSGLFLESGGSLPASATETGDLKATLTDLRAALSRWVGTASAATAAPAVASSPGGAPATGAAEPGAGRSGAAGGAALPSAHLGGPSRPPGGPASDGGAIAARLAYGGFGGRTGVVAAAPAPMGAVPAAAVPRATPVPASPGLPSASGPPEGGAAAAPFAPAAAGTTARIAGQSPGPVEPSGTAAQSSPAASPVQGPATSPSAAAASSSETRGPAVALPIAAVATEPAAAPMSPPSPSPGPSPASPALAGPPPSPPQTVATSAVATATVLAAPAPSPVAPPLGGASASTTAAAAPAAAAMADVGADAGAARPAPTAVTSAVTSAVSVGNAAAMPAAAAAVGGGTAVAPAAGDAEGAIADAVVEPMSVRRAAVADVSDASAAVPPKTAMAAGLVAQPEPEAGPGGIAAPRFVDFGAAASASGGPVEAPPDEATALAAAATLTRDRSVRPPPPRRGQPPQAQAALPVEASDDVGGGEALGRRALERTEGALQRILLEQFAVLDASGPAVAPQAGASREWTAELPLATSTGTSIVQMTVERDGGRGGETEAAAPNWRIRFALDVEPIGPVHARVALSGAHLSVGLWVERPAEALRLADEAGALAGALADLGVSIESLHLQAGRPPAPTTAATSRPTHFVDVSL